MCRVDGLAAVNAGDGECFQRRVRVLCEVLNGQGGAVKKDGGDVDAITASTITSRAYSDGLALAVKVFDAIGRTPMLLMEDDVISSEQSESSNL